jgi:serine/threonine-protein kinase
VSPSASRPKSPSAHLAKGRLILDTNPWVQVFLNGKSLGQTPLLNLPLPAGRHFLKLVNEAKGVRSTIQVDIEPGKTTVKKLDL